MLKSTVLFLLLLLLLITTQATGQKLRIQNYGISARSFETSSVGNNPLTIGGILKNQKAYQDFIRTLSYNGLSGNPGNEALNTFYASAEWKVDSAQSRFWKKHTVEAGLLVTSRIAESAGSLDNHRHVYSSDTAFHRDTYALFKNQQFAGVQVGLNRRHKIFKRLQLFSGFHLQGSFALVHHYKQQLDSFGIKRSGVSTFTTTNLPRLKGKNFFQWQAMVPVGLEYKIQRQWFLRVELLVSIVGGRYRPGTIGENEAHGVGLSLIYQPTKKHKR